jgi:hypothetical protein
MLRWVRNHRDKQKAACDKLCSWTQEKNDVTEIEPGLQVSLHLSTVFVASSSDVGRVASVELHPYHSLCLRVVRFGIEAGLLESPLMRYICNLRTS